MKTIRPFLVLLAVLSLSLLLPRSGIGAITVFTYQGELGDDGVPAEGTFEMVFRLLLAGTATQVGSPISEDVEVRDGVFSVPLDFGGGIFNGTDYDLQIAVKEKGAPGLPIPLDPPQRITPTPEAIHAMTASQVPDTALSPNVPVIVNGVLGLRDPRSTLQFGPSGECSIGIDPQFPGLVERDPTGFRLLGQDEQGCRLIFGPTMECTIEIDPLGPEGLLLRDPRGIRIFPRDGLPLLFFGPTDECSLGVDPQFPGLVERDPTGFRLLGRNNQGCRLIFGPTMDCTVEIDPQGPMGLLLRDPKGIRILPPDPQIPAVLRFGPTDDCSLGLDVELPGLVERDPTGFRLLGRNNRGCRLIFGPTMDCTVEVDPDGPRGLLLRDPDGIRVLDPKGAGGSLLFGPTDLCSLSVDPQFTGLVERDPVGFRLLGRDQQGCRLLFGPTDECTVEVNPEGPSGLLLRDPKGVRVLNPDPDPNQPNQLLFGPTDECRISVGPRAIGKGNPLMIFDDPNGFLFEGGGNAEFEGSVFAEEFIQTSSRRYKENVRPIAEPLEKIQRLKGVNFDWVPEKGGKPAIGFIAEDVGQVIPEVVAWEDDRTAARGINYGHLVALAVEGIKAQQGTIESLQQENAALADRLAKLEKLVMENAQKGD